MPLRTSSLFSIFRANGLVGEFGTHLYKMAKSASWVHPAHGSLDAPHDRAFLRREFTIFPGGRGQGSLEETRKRLYQFK